MAQLFQRLEGWCKIPRRDYALRQHFHHHAAVYPFPKPPDFPGVIRPDCESTTTLLINTLFRIIYNMTNKSKIHRREHCTAFFFVA